MIILERTLGIGAGPTPGGQLRILVAQEGRSDDVILNDPGQLRTGIRVLAERSGASRRDIFAAIRRTA